MDGGAGGVGEGGVWGVGIRHRNPVTPRSYIGEKLGKVIVHTNFPHVFSLHLWGRNMIFMVVRIGF